MDEVPPFSLIPLPADEVIREACRQCGVTEDDIVDMYPSTHLQDGIIVLSIKQSGTYIANFAFKLPDSLHIVRYRASWAQVVAHLPILRTRIIYTADGGFRQVVLKSGMEWSELDTNSLESAFTSERKLMETVVGQPLSKYAVAHTKDQGCVFIWTAHHCNYDGWTVSKVFSLVEKVYSNMVNEAEVNGLLDIGTTVMPFNGFIRYLSDRDSEQTASYWSKYLNGAPSPSFPTMRTGGYQAVANVVLHHEVLLGNPQETPSGSITLATKLRATWGLLLGLYENSQDVIFGTTLSGRNSGANRIHSVMGPTITTVPIRIQIPDAASPIGPWLETIQRQAVRMIPFEQVSLQTISKLHGHAQTAAGFRTLFLVQNMRFGNDSEQSHLGLKEPGGQLASFYTYPLVISCTIRDNSNVMLTAVYDDSILDERAVGRLLDQFANLFRQLHEAPARLSFSQLEMLPDSDTHQIRQWNSSLIPIEECLVHSEIHKMVKQQPDRLAIVAWDGSLSYNEMHSNARHLAQYLRQEHCILPEDRVPFCLDKSRWVVVVMLGILQAGGVVVGLNPAHPPKHRSQILHQIQPKVIITTPNYAHLFPDQPIIVISSSSDKLHIITPDTVTISEDESRHVLDDTHRQVDGYLNGQWGMIIVCYINASVNVESQRQDSS
ncbi:HC-toxin synthetase [Fusarium heterosporum]|uniref:HC-toxin synthetase n=1 Tax=Fusarium heterosporum TaxID=42747 RepID=A0A8H5WGG6_FUSHE|nr:HC-toxin synthetase [Fusarium heterosporum]